MCRREAAAFLVLMYSFQIVVLATAPTEQPLNCAISRIVLQKSPLSRNLETIVHTCPTDVSLFDCSLGRPRFLTPAISPHIQLQRHEALHVGPIALIRSLAGNSFLRQQTLASCPSTGLGNVVSICTIQTCWRTASTSSSIAWIAVLPAVAITTVSTIPTSAGRRISAGPAVTSCRTITAISTWPPRTASG